MPLALNEQLVLAQRYAPIQFFDNSAGLPGNWGYPYDPQVYLDNGCGGPAKKFCQMWKLDTVSNPTYFMVMEGAGRVDIDYWSFYGRQKACFHLGSIQAGEHDGDWEHVQAHIVKNKLQSVTYWQHTGHYTTSEFQRDGDHPHVYVGKIAHGSYYNEGGFDGGCGYYWDYRKPHGHASNELHTEKNLVNLRNTGNGPHAAAWIKKQIHIYGSDPEKDYKAITDPNSCEDAGCNYKSCKGTFMMFHPKCIK